MYDPWAEKVTGVQDKHFSKTTEELEASSCKAIPLKKDRPLQGWALNRKGRDREQPRVLRISYWKNLIKESKQVTL